MLPLTTTLGSSRLEVLTVNRGRLLRYDSNNSVNRKLQLPPNHFGLLMQRTIRQRQRFLTLVRVITGGFLEELGRCPTKGAERRLSCIQGLSGASLSSSSCLVMTVNEWLQPRRAGQLRVLAFWEGRSGLPRQENNPDQPQR